MKGFRALFDWLCPLSDDESATGDLTDVEVVDGGAPGGDAGGAVLLAVNPGDAPTVKPAPQEESQVLNLDSYKFSYLIFLFLI